MSIISVWSNIFIFLCNFLLKTFLSLLTQDDVTKSHLWGPLILKTLVCLLICIKFGMCLRSSGEAFFPMSFAPPHTTATSSLINLSASTFSVLVVTYNLAAGFTKPVTPICISCASFFLFCFCFSRPFMMACNYLNPVVLLCFNLYRPHVIYTPLYHHLQSTSSSFLLVEALE